MLDVRELTLLSDWCRPRSMTWHPLLRGGHTSVLLDHVGPRRCWDRILLTRVDEEFELVTEAGELLACASDLHSVLDLLDGGVAEPMEVVARPSERPYTGAMVL